MLGLLLIYFIWKKFAELAVEYGKHKWGFAILGIAIYYVGSFIGGIIIALISMLMGNESFIEDQNSLVLGLIALPFGLLACWGLYAILKNMWSKKLVDSIDTLDESLISKS